MCPEISGLSPRYGSPPCLAPAGAPPTTPPLEVAAGSGISSSTATRGGGPQRTGPLGRRPHHRAYARPSSPWSSGPPLPCWRPPDPSGPPAPRLARSPRLRRASPGPGHEWPTGPASRPPPGIVTPTPWQRPSNEHTNRHCATGFPTTRPQALPTTLTALPPCSTPPRRSSAGTPQHLYDQPRCMTVRTRLYHPWGTLVRMEMAAVWGLVETVATGRSRPAGTGTELARRGGGAGLGCGPGCDGRDVQLADPTRPGGLLPRTGHRPGHPARSLRDAGRLAGPGPHHPGHAPTGRRPGRRDGVGRATSTSSGGPCGNWNPTNVEG